jgi:hypothetical protein
MDPPGWIEKKTPRVLRCRNPPTCHFLAPPAPNFLADMVTMAARLRLADALAPNPPDLLIMGLLGTNGISDLNSRLMATASKRVVAVYVLVTHPEAGIQWKCGP